MNHDIARARSRSRNQRPRYQDDSGKEARLGEAEEEAQRVEAASCPSRRSSLPAAMPYVIAMRAIHTRAPTRARMRLLGTSTDERVAEVEHAGSERVCRRVLGARSRFICSDAMPRLVRSRKLATNSAKSSGSNRHETLRIVSRRSSSARVDSAVAVHRIRACSTRSCTVYS